jgi:hypothetical protein
MVKKLKNLILTEVSLVDRGANPGAMITLFKRAAPTEIETPRDSDRNFGARGRGKMHDLLWASYDNRRRALGPAQASRAFELAWADLTDSEKDQIRAEEAAVEAAKEAAAAAAETEQQKEIAKQMNDFKLEEIVKLAHAVADGRSGNRASRADWYRAISKAAEAHRKPQESPQQAFARYVTTNVDGRAMFKCWRDAAGSDYVPPAPEPAPVVKTNGAHARLLDIAAGYVAANPKLTRYDALSKAYASHPDLATLAKRGAAAA